MAISRSEPRRRLKLPRNLSGGRQLQPYSRADAPYFRSPGFYVRVGGLAAVVAVGLALLLLRAWSIQVLHGKQYAQAAHSQAFRTVPLLGSRGAILDDKGKLIAGTTGHAVVDADAASLGSRGVHGRWNPSAEGLQELGRLARLTGKNRGVLVARIRAGVFRSPFAPAVVIQHPSDRAHELPAGAEQSVPGLRGRRRGQPKLSAGRVRQRVPRPARADQPAGAPCRHLQGREGGRGRRAERRRGRVRLAPEQGLRAGEGSRGLAGSDRRRAPRAAAEAAADRCSSRSTRGCSARPRARSHTGWSRRA